MTTSTERVAMEVQAIRARADRAFRSPQLGRSALDNRYLLVTTPTGAVDSFGNPTPQTSGLVGVQFDGTTTAATVAGPNPPQPVAPTVTPTISGLEVAYSGAFVGGALAPMDWARAEIHVSPTNDISGLMSATRKAIIPNANGATINVTGLSPAIGYYVAVIAWSQAGKPSPVSASVGPVQPLLTPPELVDIDFNTLGTHIYYTTGSPPVPGGEMTGDLWLKEIASGPPPVYQTYRWNATTWVLLADQTATNAALAAEAAAAAVLVRGRLYAQASAPTGLTGADTAIWLDTDDGNRSYSWSGSAWVSRQIGNAAIAPASLVASTVLVTGSVTAALLESIVVLATTIIAGIPTGSHARMEPTGFRVFRADPDGTLVPDEVIRMGTNTNDYFGVVNSAGNLVASVDDTGSAAFTDLNVAGDLIVKGQNLDSYIINSNIPAGAFRQQAPGLVGGVYYGPIGTAKVGVAEVNGWLVNGRRYEISWQLTWTATAANVEGVFGVHARSSNTDVCAAPVVTDATQEEWLFACPKDSQWGTSLGNLKYTATKTGRHRFLLSMYRGSGGIGSGLVDVISDPRFPVSLDISDLGPAKPFTGQFSQGSGTFDGGTPPAAPPTPVTQYNTGWMPPAGWTSMRGDGSVRSDVAGPVQGWDPSGFNGDGSGFWWWTLPSITGTVNEVWVWLYSSHWYYNSGGTAKLNAIKSGAGHPINSYKVVGGDYEVHFPKPGSVQVDISGWASAFANAAGANRAVGISVGASGGTNLLYYGRFDGPSARLQLKYTQ